MEALVTSRHLSGLTDPVLPGNNLGNIGVEMLVASQHVAQFAASQIG